MDLLYTASSFRALRSTHTLRSRSITSLPTCRRLLDVRASLPFPIQKGKYYRELEAAVDVVERACRLCVDVKSSLFSSDGRSFEKNDQTPVTVADFGVQALVSLELGKQFPSIPLVAEEDLSFIQSNNLEDSVVNAVTDKASVEDKYWTHDDVLKAIDRGGKGAFVFGAKPATYWVLDPIDGTRGFLKGSDALYVVGLALIVEGDVVLGVMGCPNWRYGFSSESTTEVQKNREDLSASGIIMVAHIGCGTWTKRLPNMLDSWTRCFVDDCCLVHKARFCIPESQTWESLPLSATFTATANADSIKDNQILLFPACCGSLCKYLMVASGRTSVFVLRAKIQKTVKAWDHAVGMICVHEAGGKVTDWKGSQLDLAADKNGRRIIFPSGGVLVTNGNLHNEILEMISSLSSTV
ncbi:putative PAP-specific phosphatase, mitochondrial [Juglans microcarpa x Juglans regia]|uniref:putative PAP-specific phosphatase, mitochondrial n=1 Tax=Juglans microcarpa x Juglans regia TaxID=2249226 RepID=UPI001B7F5560|nr:putative PAP-specific phosphatase, mitochondrial [Juglans microcarpa x Juglans regia]